MRCIFDGRTLATTSGIDGQALGPGTRPSADLDPHSDRLDLGAAFSADGAKISVTDNQGRVSVLASSPEGGHSSTMNSFNAGYPIRSAALSPDSRLCDRRRLRNHLLVGTAGRRLATIRSRLHPKALAISPGGQWVGRSNHHDTVFLRNGPAVESRKRSIDPTVEAMPFSPRKTLSIWGWG